MQKTWQKTLDVTSCVVCEESTERFRARDEHATARDHPSFHRLTGLVNDGMVRASASTKGPTVTARKLAGLFATVLLLTLGAVGPVSQAARAAFLPTLWMFPGSSCTTTLQQCIDDVAAPGDTVEIDTDTPIDAQIDVSKSLTLQAAPGYSPTITNGIVGSLSAGSQSLTLSDLNVQAAVWVRTIGPGGDTVNLDHLRVYGSPNDPVPAIAISAGASANVSITANSVFGSYGQYALVGLYPQQPAGEAVSFSVVGNHLSGHGTGASEGGAGIEFASSNDASTEADIFNNSIWDVARCYCGAEAGVTLYPNGSGTSRVNLVGNTVDRSATEGLAFDDNLSPGGHISLDAYDNIFSDAAQYGVRILAADPASSTLSFGHNDYSANPLGNLWDGISPGSGNLKKQPGFVDEPAGQLALTAGSPMIDAGQVCTPGGVGQPDAAGMARLMGPSVDLGAYERGASAPTGQVFLGGSGGDALAGTSGADILCGYAGADSLDGSGGADFLDGGGGIDRLVGGPGPDRLLGGLGADACLNAKDSVGGNDHVDGGKGVDAYRADPGDYLISVEHVGCI